MIALHPSAHITLNVVGMIAATWLLVGPAATGQPWLFVALWAVLGVGLFAGSAWLLRVNLLRQRGPQSVYVVRPDDTRIAANIVPLGIDPTGIYVWGIVSPIVNLGDEIHIGVMPARTAITWQGQEPAS